MILRTFNYGLMIIMIDNDDLDEQTMSEDIIFNYISEFNKKIL